MLIKVKRAAFYNLFPKGTDQSLFQKDLIKELNKKEGALFYIFSQLIIQEVINMIKNRIAAMIPAVLLAMSLAACGSASSNAPAGNPPAEEQQTPSAETPAEEAVGETSVAAAETPAEEAVGGTLAAAEAATEAPAEEAVGETSAAAEAATEAAAAEDLVQYTNKEYVLSIPAGYNDLLNVKAAEDSEDGILFEVYEQASLDAAKARGEEEENGLGWLFSIGTTDEATLHEKQCDDMSGEDVIARNEDGTYFIQYHPTDVRIARESDITDEDMEVWGKLNEWANTIPETFVNDNGLILDKLSNTDLDMYLARIAYQGFTGYTLSSLEHGVWGPAAVDPAPHLEKLKDVSFENAGDIEAPDGEYVVFTVPEGNVRYDFFFDPDGQNLVREVHEVDEDSYEVLFKANVPEGSPTLNEIMNEWYLDVVNNGGEAIDAH